MLKLYHYFRSSTSYRVRVALNYKELDYELIAVNLVKGEQFDPEYLKLNPQGAVPTLIDDGFVVTQSMAIMDYLNEKYPGKSYYPDGLEARSFVRRIAQIVSCDIHPVNNLRVLKYLTNELGVEENQKIAWYQKWIHDSFNSVEELLKMNSFHKEGGYCCGETPTIADMCLIPQVYNARRFECDMDQFPLIQAVEDKCLAHPAFIKADPHTQPDTPEELRKAG